jgi:hypothetical protein
VRLFGRFYGNILWKLSKVSSVQLDVRFDSRQEIVISYNVIVLGALRYFRSEDLGRSVKICLYVVLHRNQLKHTCTFAPDNTFSRLLYVLFIFCGSFDFEFLADLLHTGSTDNLMTGGPLICSFGRINSLKTKVNVNYIYIHLVPRSRHHTSRLWEPIS